MLPNCFIASPRILQLSDKASSPILVEAGIFTLSMAFNPKQSSAIPTPTPVNPFAISFHDKPASLTIAVDNVFIAIASNKIELPALISPLESYLSKVLLIDLNDALSIANIAAIADNDFPTSALFNPAILFKDNANIPIAADIVRSVVAFIPVVKDSKESCIESRVSVNLSFTPFAGPKKSSSFSFMSPITETTFITPAVIPPPISPLNISPREILFLSHPAISLIACQTCDTTFIIRLPILGNVFPSLSAPSDAALSTLDMPSEIVVSIPVKPLESNPLFKAVKKSPITAVAVKKRFTSAFTPSEVISLPKAVPRLASIFPNTDTTENKPLNVLFSFLAVLSLIFI